MKHRDAFYTDSLSEKEKEIADILLDALDASSMSVDEMEEPFLSADMYKVVKMLIGLLGSTREAKAFVKKVNLWRFFNDIRRECYDHFDEFLAVVVSKVIMRYQKKKE